MFNRKLKKEIKHLKEQVQKLLGELEEARRRRGIYRDHTRHLERCLVEYQTRKVEEPTIDNLIDELEVVFNGR